MSDSNKNDFQIASEIAALLKDVENERQARILRWVSESLGLKPSVLKNEVGSGGTSGASLAPPPPSGRMVDIKTFMDSKQPKSDNQFAAATAYYYRFEAPVEQRMDAITPDVLQNATRLSGRARIKDPGKALHNAKMLGYLDTAERGAYRINTVGENLVAMTMPGAATKKKK